jgi:anti-sigma regulatory factor (Ser/Thr protein kinase)
MGVDCFPCVNLLVFVFKLSIVYSSVYNPSMAKPSQLKTLIDTVTADVVAHPQDLTACYAERLGISRVAANRYVRQLEERGWIARSGPTTRPVYSPGYRRLVKKTYPLKGLEEDMAWSRDFRPCLSLQSNVLGIAQHGFTEMLNNAIDHSGGDQVIVRAEQDQTRLEIIVGDNGVGIFEKITHALNLPDKRLALLELSKGKFTTDPARHSGEGVFFTSRMFDGYHIDANGLRFTHHAHRDKDRLDAAGVSLNGTFVVMSVALDTQRTTTEVFQAFMNAPEDYDFSKTIVPMKLAQIGDEQLVSRSQAKRLIARFDRFKTVVLDFTGIESIGQAFADELFRVYAVAHPQVELLPTHMTEQVERMWLRAIAPKG